MILSCAAPTVQLMFNSQLSKSTAEKFTGHILQAFESVLGSSVTIEIRCEANKDAGSSVQLPLVLPSINDGSSQVRDLNDVGTEKRRSEIVEEEASHMEHRNTEQQVDGHATYKNQDGTSMGQVLASQKVPIVKAHLVRRKLSEQSQSRSLVKSKVSLAHVIQQAEGQRSGWSKRKAVSIAEKLEQENLYVVVPSSSFILTFTIDCFKRKCGIFWAPLF